MGTIIPTFKNMIIISDIFSKKYVSFRNNIET